MLLVWLILIPLIAGPLAWAGGRDPRRPRWIALAAMGLDLILTLVLWLQPDGVPATPSVRWLASWHIPWIPRFGISIHLGVDGLSLLLILLTCVLGLAAVTASLTEIRERVGFFHCNLLWVLAGVIGVFLALDLFLFFVFWEIMLVPMYLLISLWGGEPMPPSSFSSSRRPEAC